MVAAAAAARKRPRMTLGDHDVAVIFSSYTVLCVLHAQMWLLACGREHLALPCCHSGTLDQFTTILGRRRLAVVMCIPPRGYVECLIHVGRVMGGGNTPYDIVVFSSDCGLAGDPEWFSGITRWRLKEFYESLDGMGSSVVGCTEWPAQHVGPADSWSAWFEMLHPEKLGLNRYQSLVLISPEGVESLMAFSLDLVRHSMWQRHGGWLVHTLQCRHCPTATTTMMMTLPMAVAGSSHQSTTTMPATV